MILECIVFGWYVISLGSCNTEGKKQNNCIELSSAENYESIKCGDLSFVFVILLALSTYEDNSKNKPHPYFFLLAMHFLCIKLNDIKKNLII